MDAEQKESAPVEIHLLDYRKGDKSEPLKWRPTSENYKPVVASEEELAVCRAELLDVPRFYQSESQLILDTQRTLKEFLEGIESLITKEEIDEISKILQGHPDWFKYRKCRVTASNVKYVVKFTGYGTPKASLAKSILGLWTIDKGKCGQKAANHQGIKNERSNSLSSGGPKISALWNYAICVLKRSYKAKSNF